jgi:DNA repair protein RadC
MIQFFRAIPSNVILKGLDRAEISEMLKVKGVSVAKVAQIKAALELGKRTQSLSNKPRQFETAAEVFRFIEPRFVGARNEIAMALYLDGQNHLLEDRVIAEGIPTQSTIYIRRVLEGALAASASGVVLIHNHPSGEPEPSTDVIADLRGLSAISVSYELSDGAEQVWVAGHQRQLNKKHALDIKKYLGQSDGRLWCANLK